MRVRLTWPLLRLLGAMAVAVSLLGVPATVRAGPITVSIYSGSTLSGGGAPYSGFVGSFSSPDIKFATNTGYSWHPFGLGSFGADIKGILSVKSTGIYALTLNSDDGSQLFIDGSLVVDNGGVHPPTITTSSTTLTAGTHPFEVQFFECCGGPSGVDLDLPFGVSFVPEPASLTLFGIGAAGAFGYSWLRRQRRA